MYFWSAFTHMFCWRVETKELLLSGVPTDPWQDVGVVERYYTRMGRRMHAEHTHTHAPPDACVCVQAPHTHTHTHTHAHSHTHKLTHSHSQVILSFLEGEPICRMWNWQTGRLLKTAVFFLPPLVGGLNSSPHKPSRILYILHRFWYGGLF